MIQNKIINDLHENKEQILSAISYYLGNDKLKKPLYKVGKYITSDLIYYSLVKALYGTNTCNYENNIIFAETVDNLWNEQVSARSLNKLINKEIELMKKLKLNIFTLQERYALYDFVLETVNKILSTDNLDSLTNCLSEELYFNIFKQSINRFLNKKN